MMSYNATNNSLGSTDKMLFIATYILLFIPQSSAEIYRDTFPGYCMVFTDLFQAFTYNKSLSFLQAASRLENGTILSLFRRGVTGLQEKTKFNLKNGIYRSENRSRFLSCAISCLLYLLRTFLERLYAARIIDCNGGSEIGNKIVIYLPGIRVNSSN